MRTLILAFLVVLAGVTQADAAGKTKGGRRAPVARATPPTPPRAPEARPVEARAEATETTAEPRAESRSTQARAPKAKVYSFSGLDVEGKMKTPQLLYFLNRVKLELDTTGREKRSFLKELEQSSDDKGL
jgi:hypothetical protein